nr:MAG TPA: hypothetical protein [Bacteriophage sp.]
MQFLMVMMVQSELKYLNFILKPISRIKLDRFGYLLHTLMIHGRNSQVY